MKTKNNGASKEFTRDHTCMTKGILVIMMLIHHAINVDMVEAYGVRRMIADPVLSNQIVLFCKTCIAGFAFLSAYGMTLTLKKQKEDNLKNYFFLSFRRLIKLFSGVFFIYVLAVVWQGFALGKSFWEIYGEGGRNLFRAIGCMLLDLSGMAALCNTPTINITWWYLSFIVPVILLMPLFYMLYKKYRYFLIPAVLLLPFLLVGDRINFIYLLPATVLGIAFAFEGWLTGESGLVVRLFKTCGCLLLFVVAYDMTIHVGIMCGYALMFVLPCIVYNCVGYIPILRDILRFLGKHATNIFLTHTFLYYYFYPDFIYSFRDSWKILGVLLAFSLCVSLAIELIKKLTGYQWLCGKILDMFDRRWLQDDRACDT